MLVKQELIKLRQELDLLQCKEIKEDEVQKYIDSGYEVIRQQVTKGYDQNVFKHLAVEQQCDLSNKEYHELLILRKIKTLETIRSCAVFFVVAFVIIAVLNLIIAYRFFIMWY